MPILVVSFAVRRELTSCAKGSSACDACTDGRISSQIPVEAARAPVACRPHMQHCEKAKSIFVCGGWGDRSGDSLWGFESLAEVQLPGL